MAYNLKYQSDFYNIFGKLVSVKIYKKDYSSHAPILLRTSEVTIEVNYQDENTPIIGTGAKVNVVNTGAFDSLEDLLTSLEKQFYCTIEYNSVIVFHGFSICDLNEQQLLPWARITLQFTDYLHRLENDQPVLLDDIGLTSNLNALLHNALITMMGADNPIPVCVNSTLFETTMAHAVTDTAMEQVWMENDMFYSNTTDHDNTYVALNKILLSLGAFLYSYGTSWYVERQEDILRSGNWVRYPDFVLSVINGAETPASLKQELNKQDGDFKYVEESQNIEYDSGLQKLVLNLKDKKFDTFVFNNFTTSMFSVSDKTPDAGTLAERTWYAYNTVQEVAVGYSFRGINKYFKWTYDAGNTNFEDEGLYYSFEVYFNNTEEVPTELSVSFKMAGEQSLNFFVAARLKFALRFDGGSLSNQYLGYVLGPDNVTQNLVYGTAPIINRQEFVPTSDKEVKMWTLSQSFNLTDRRVIPQPSPLPPSTLLSIWEALGKPTSQKFIIMFFPIEYKLPVTSIYERINYIGDIEVTITQQEILNKLTYTVNRNFIKTDEIDIDFFDLVNKNFSNGLLTGTYPALTKTALWTSQWNTTPKPLMDILAADRFRKYYHTAHKLKAKIMFDGHLKPFSVLTDDQLWTDSSNNNMKLIVNSYVWDLNNGMYDIETIEYTDEEITFDEAGELIIPVGLTVTQPEAGEHMHVQWTAVTGATGYMLQRKPYSYNPGYQNDSWITVYIGSSTSFDDNIQDEPYVMTGLTSISYRICAYVPNGPTAYSAVVTGTWYPTS
jgi:hypothetical protein